VVLFSPIVLCRQSTKKGPMARSVHVSPARPHRQGAECSGSCIDLLEPRSRGAAFARICWRRGPRCTPCPDYPWPWFSAWQRWFAKGTIDKKGGMAKGQEPVVLPNHHVEKKADRQTW